MESIRLGGPVHGIVTKKLYPKLCQGVGGWVGRGSRGPGVGLVGGGGGPGDGWVGVVGGPIM